ncbi:MAG TPA: hypothetical protein VFJ59_00530 [Pseudolabrys sp.]|nr:hypothetical protein [Pseudolabrys sp.]
MVLKERIHALADHARARRKGDEMPEKSEETAAKWAVTHEWENWAALHPDDLKSANAGMYFFTHLQQKKPELLNFASSDKSEAVHVWLLQQGRIKD